MTKKVFDVITFKIMQFSYRGINTHFGKMIRVIRKLEEKREVIAGKKVYFESHPELSGGDFRIYKQ